MLFWHLGGTIALIRYAFRDERMDLRMLALGAVAPDLIDTSFGLAVFSETQSVRLIGHSLALSGAVMVAVLLTTRRGRPRKRWMPLAIGMLMHLFLDAMWAAPETLWWPFLGFSFSTVDAATAGEYLSAVFNDPWVWALELIGLAYLMELGRRAKITSADARRELWATGRINVPIRQG